MSAMKSDPVAEATTSLQAFASKHGLELVTKGQAGFGRPAVGLSKGQGYVDVNPVCVLQHAPYVKAPDGFPEDGDDRLLAPDGVDAYHKHSCLCVLAQTSREESADYGTALVQLATWIAHLEAQGELEVVAFPRGGHPMQQMLTGSVGYAIRLS
jgi:hypothetical protein